MNRPSANTKPPVALITGGSRGIGRAITQELARRGYAVAINYYSRNDEAVVLKDQLNAVAPGFTKTELADMIDSQATAESRRMIPLDRWGLPEEIASVVGFVTSDDASYINGITLVVDGGRSASEQDLGPLSTVSSLLEENNHE